MLIFPQMPNLVPTLRTEKFSTFDRNVVTNFINIVNHVHKVVDYKTFYQMQELKDEIKGSNRISWKFFSTLTEKWRKQTISVIFQAVKTNKSAEFAVITKNQSHLEENMCIFTTEEAFTDAVDGVVLH